MTRHELAQALGVTSRTVGMWETRGLPVRRKGGRGKGNSGDYDLDECRAWAANHGLGAQLRTLAQQPSSLPPLDAALGDLDAIRRMVPRNLAEAQYLGQVEELLKRRLANDEAEGRLVDAEEVAQAQFEMARQVRDAMMGITPRVQDVLASISDPGEVARVLNAEIRQALESAAKQAGELDSG